MQLKLFYIGMFILFFGVRAHANVHDSIKELYHPRNTIYAELYGNSMIPYAGGFYSVNYERVGFRVGKFYWGARIGIAYNGIYQGGNDPFVYAIYVNWLVNVQFQFHKYFAVECGSGFIKRFDSENGDDQYFNMMIGLRFNIWPGFFMRLSFVPIAYDPKSWHMPYVQFLPGLALGWSFGKWNYMHPERHKRIQF